jgi:hypothetical protein
MIREDFQEYDIMRVNGLFGLLKDYKFGDLALKDIGKLKL